MRCAAPGGKTSYLAELMWNTGRLVACDLFASRVALLRGNLARLGVENAETFVHDCLRAGPPLTPASFDRILVDAPCSNTGVLRRRVDVRWRLTEEDFIRMPAQQLALLRRTAALLKPVARWFTAPAVSNPKRMIASSNKRWHDSGTALSRKPQHVTIRRSR
jgi:16S rRNA (cytosine967-C5)-methyltransferase